MTKHPTFSGSGTTQEYLAAFLRSLNSDADPYKQVDFCFRCYCKVTHEFHNFYWFEDEETPHILTSCDDFAEYEPDDAPEQPERTRPVDKRKNPAHEAADVAEKQHAR